MVDGVSRARSLFFITWFKGCIDIEGLHPLEGGFLRMKYRTDRRNFPLENPIIFYPKTFLETFWKQIKWISLYLHLRLIYRKVRHDPKKLEYMDLALEPVTENETETRELFQSEAAHKFVEKMHRIEKRRYGTAKRCERTAILRLEIQDTFSSVRRIKDRSRANALGQIVRLSVSINVNLSCIYPKLSYNYFHLI